MDILLSLILGFTLGFMFCFLILWAIGDDNEI
nr:MAG TPA: G-rich domain on putative tyrosine kinase [Caudoviricetes sp.]